MQIKEKPRPEVISGSGAVVITCDHASNAIPPELGGLGLPPDQLDRHIAYDIGAAAVARQLAERLDATAVFAPVSRLVCDVNRDPQRQEPFPPVSDGIAIPGNQALQEAERQARLDAFFHPFHQAVEQAVARAQAVHERVILFAMHSFTPVMDGYERPWQIGFLYQHDPRLFQAFRDVLAARYEFTIGDNQPYSGSELYYTMDRHGQARDIQQVTVEVRQDLIAEGEGQAQWAAILAQAVKDMAGHPALA